MRKIFCTGCHKHLGEIRDARLLKGIKFLCPKCETRMVASDLHKKTDISNPFKDFFGGS